jgi:hypothetical protein
MPIELDKGHDQPIFGPEGRPNMAERFRLAGEIVRDFGGRAKGGVAVSLRIGMMTRTYSVILDPTPTSGPTR